MCKTHFLLAAFVARPLYTRLSLFLVMVSGAVIVAIETAWAVAHHTTRAPLPFRTAIDAGAMGKDLTPDGDGTCRAQRRGRRAVLSKAL